jgi:Protein of Unknown function (DUF2784)
VNPETALHVAQLVLALHLAAATFVILGMIVIPIGAWRHWLLVSSFWWRAAHLGAISIIALQKVLGQTCFLSVWEFNLLAQAQQAHVRVPPLHALAIGVMHWNMPLWFFTLLYVALFLYVAWLWRLVPVRGWPRRKLSHKRADIKSRSLV